MSEIESLSWEEFQPQFQWAQGDHVTLVGPTKSGKTTLARQILQRRKYAVALITKNRDSSVDAFEKEGWNVFRDWAPVPKVHPKVLLKPGLKNARDKGKQRKAFRRCLDNIFMAGGWCVYSDEVRYITKTLQLAGEMELLWLQGRSNKVSVVVALQRPFYVPQEAYSQATHLFLWNDTEKRNLERLSELNSVNSAIVREQVVKLTRHEVLYVCTDPDRPVMFRTKLPSSVATK